jgi:competence protein ComEA
MIHSQVSILRYALALTMASMVVMAGTATALAHSSSSKTTSPATKATSQVDVNNANLKTLETLPGVSPTLAKNIVSGRPYSNLSDLAHVNGMGQKKANALKHHVTFGPASGATTTKSTKKSHHTKASSSSAGSSTTPSPTEMSPSPEPSASSTEPSASSREPSGSSTEPSASSSKLAPGQTVDINTASAEELDKLPGIGPSKAQAIVDYRKEHGDFKSVDDIKNVHGIKEGTFSKIKDYITVGQ